MSYPELFTFPQKCGELKGRFLVYLGLIESESSGSKEGRSEVPREISSGPGRVYLRNRFVQAFLGRGHLSTLPAPTGVIF